MENKYYTPDISDLKVGYECEIKTLQDDKIDWLPITIDIDGDVNSDLHICLLKLINDMLRTPHLTDQQIINEGWEPKEIFENYVCIYQKGTKEKGFELVYNFEKHNIMFRRLYFYGLDEEYTNTKLTHDFLECKSINEFKIISKLLNIK